MIDDDFVPHRTQLLALGYLLVRAQVSPSMPFFRERDLYELMQGEGFGGEREVWLTELQQHGLIFVEPDNFRAGDELDESPHNVGLTPAGTYYVVARAPLVAENYRGITADFPAQVVDAPWAVQAYYSPSADNVAPTADAFVRFDHNEAAYAAALGAVDAVTEALRSDNEIGDRYPELRDEKLDQLVEIRKLLEKREGWRTKIIAMGWGVLGYLITQFADRPVGYAAEQAWHALQTVIGIR